MVIAQEGGKLVMRFSHTAELVGDMEHWQHDTFVVRWRERWLNADAFVNFALTPDGAIREAADGGDFAADRLQFRLPRPAAGAGREEREAGDVALSWLAIALVVIGVWLAIKVVGFVLKLALWGLVLFGVYWLRRTWAAAAVLGSVGRYMRHAGGVARGPRPLEVVAAEPAGDVDAPRR